MREDRAHGLLDWMVKEGLMMGSIKKQLKRPHHSKKEPVIKRCVVRHREQLAQKPSDGDELLVMRYKMKAIN